MFTVFPVWLFIVIVPFIGLVIVDKVIESPSESVTDTSKSRKLFCDRKIVPGFTITGTAFAGLIVIVAGGEV